MNGRGSKAKGSLYERDVAKYLTEEIGIQVDRMPMSGGGTFGTKLGGADLLGLPYLHPELKRCERLNFREAMRQAETSIKASGSDVAPVVITRKNREPMQDSLVLMRISDWLELYRAFLKQQGHLP